MMYLKNHVAEKAHALEMLFFHDPMYLNHTSISVVSFCPLSRSFALNKTILGNNCGTKGQVEKKKK
jgi:hypothetical protein